MLPNNLQVESNFDADLGVTSSITNMDIYQKCKY